MPPTVLSSNSERKSVALGAAQRPPETMVATPAAFQHLPGTQTSGLASDVLLNNRVEIQGRNIIKVAL